MGGGVRFNAEGGVRIPAGDGAIGVSRPGRGVVGGTVGRCDELPASCASAACRLTVAGFLRPAAVRPPAAACRLGSGRSGLPRDPRGGLLGGRRGDRRWLRGSVGASCGAERFSGGNRDPTSRTGGAGSPGGSDRSASAWHGDAAGLHFTGGSLRWGSRAGGPRSGDIDSHFHRGRRSRRRSARSGDGSRAPMPADDHRVCTDRGHDHLDRGATGPAAFRIEHRRAPSDLGHRWFRVATGHRHDQCDRATRRHQGDRRIPTPGGGPDVGRRRCVSGRTVRLGGGGRLRLTQGGTQPGTGGPRALPVEGRPGCPQPGDPTADPCRWVRR